MAEVAEFLDLRELARAMHLPASQLLRELVADRVDLVQVSMRVFRVEANAWATWLETRRERTQQRFVQKERLRELVAGKEPVQPADVEFRR